MCGDTMRTIRFFNSALNLLEDAQIAVTVNYVFKSDNSSAYELYEHWLSIVLQVGSKEGPIVLKVEHFMARWTDYPYNKNFNPELEFLLRRRGGISSNEEFELSQWILNRIMNEGSLVCEELCKEFNTIIRKS
jgi:hypothetical protein